MFKELDYFHGLNAKKYKTDMIQRLFVFVVFFLCGFVSVPDSMSQNHIEYTLRMPEPATHYFQVAMHVSEFVHPTIQKQGYIDVKLPVWTPGSYLVREYAKNLDRLEAHANGVKTDVRKIRKNVWRVSLPDDTHDLTITYYLYANELTVRTNFLDDQHGYVTGAATFLYADEFKDQPADLVVEPYQDWTRVSVALPALPGKPFTYRAENYDLLVDSPIEIGTHQVLHFEACGIPHEIALVGTHAPLDEDQLKADYKRICEAALTIVGTHPCQRYLFIVHHTTGGSGGLEHLHCTTLQTNRNTYAQESLYANFLGLVAHEYFHLWNVKRIRPIELGPFDYENENYTHQLWVAEGFTSMYDNHILRRAGLSSVDKYLSDVASDFTYVVNTPGTRIQSLAEASWDAWIKYYRPNENSINSQSSYYTKGAAVTTLLNLEILQATAGQRSLDDVLRSLYQTYYLGENRGFTEQEIQMAIEQVAGQSMESFFQDYIWGTAPLDFDRYLQYVGCHLENELDPELAYLGIHLAPGRPAIQQVLKDSPAYQVGLNVFDELISIDGQPITDLPRFLATKQPKEEVLIEVRRAGMIRIFEVELQANPVQKLVIVRNENPSPEQIELFNKWVWLGSEIA